MKNLTSERGWSPAPGAERAPVLIVGTPRSGTTWVSQVLGRTQGAVSIHEPDNETCEPFALRAKAYLGRFPVLAGGDAAPAEYFDLWTQAMSGHTYRSRPRRLAAKALLRTAGSDLEAAFDGGTRRLSTRLHMVSALADRAASRTGADQVIVKSVHSALSVEWIASNFTSKVVVLTRHPMNVIASHLDLGWHDSNLDTHPLLHSGFADLYVPRLEPGASPVARIAWQIGLFMNALDAAAARHPRWLVVSHEGLCRNPRRGFMDICEALDLPWTAEAEEFVDASNRPGNGLVTNRVASEQNADRWRTRLTLDEQAEAQEVLGNFRVRTGEATAS